MLEVEKCTHDACDLAPKERLGGDQYLPSLRARWVLIGSGPKAEKSGETTVLFFSAPIAAT